MMFSRVYPWARSARLAALISERKFSGGFFFPPLISGLLDQIIIDISVRGLEFPSKNNSRHISSSTVR
jgi:hypothetical protein